MKKNTKAMMERMELVNGLNRELNRKVYAYVQLVKENPERWGVTDLTMEQKCSPQSIKRTITLLREQLLLLEKEV